MTGETSNTSPRWATVVKLSCPDNIMTLQYQAHGNHEAHHRLHTEYHDPRDHEPNLRLHAEYCTPRHIEPNSRLHAEYHTPSDYKPNHRLHVDYHDPREQEPNHMLHPEYHDTRQPHHNHHRPHEQYPPGKEAVWNSMPYYRSYDEASIPRNINLVHKIVPVPGTSRHVGEWIPGEKAMQKPNTLHYTERDRRIPDAYCSNNSNNQGMNSQSGEYNTNMGTNTGFHVRIRRTVSREQNQPNRRNDTVSDTRMQELNMSDEYNGEIRSRSRVLGGSLKITINDQYNNKDSHRITDVKNYV